MSTNHTDDETDDDIEASQGITKAHYNPIFDDDGVSKKLDKVGQPHKQQINSDINELTQKGCPTLSRFSLGVSVATLASKLNMSRQSLEERRNKGTLEEIGYTAFKEGRLWKYYPINEI